MILVLLTAAALVSLAASRRKPRIVELRSDGTEGTVTVRGEHLGSGGRLEIDGLAVDPGSIDAWTPDRIVFRVPDGRSSGLLRVETRSGTSAPIFLSSPLDMPLVADERRARVTSIEPGELFPGEILVIDGFGFGPRSSHARIAFRATGTERIRTVDGVSTWIVHWSNSRIRLVVPPGIPTGAITIEINGEAIDRELEAIRFTAGTSLGRTVRYAVQQQVSLLASPEDARVVLPKIPTTTGQSSAQLLRQEGELLAEIGTAAWVYLPIADPVTESEEQEETDTRATIRRTDFVERASITVALSAGPPSIDTSLVEREEFRSAFADLLGPVDAMRTDDPVVRAIGSGRLSGFRNPLAIARLVHRIVVERFVPDPTVERNLKRAIIDGNADAYAYAGLAALIARRMGIPARRQLGLLLDDADTVHEHAWVEFFIPGIGWIPADPALGDGMHAESLSSLASFYGDDRIEGTFGRIDDRRITLFVDAVTVPYIYPDGLVYDPAESYAPGIVRLELPPGTDMEALEIDWSVPDFFAD